ncbi:MAG: hybrid sensor histidine kinase/response regulator, partial [Omnitrophica bacterium]|nr:hybrid sensor histidine kinase/response regulator [Candidatus Omnitrophota bacterium]
MSIIRKIISAISLIVVIPFLVACYLYNGVFVSLGRTGKILILVTVFIIVLGLTILLKLTRILTKLQKDLVSAGHGDLNRDVRTEENTGLGDMALSVNEVIKQLKDNADELEKRAFLVERATKAFKSRAEFQERYFSDIVHDLRAPLINIDKSILLLLDKMAGEISAEQEKFLKIINQNCSRLKHSINNILEISKEDAGKSILNVEAFNITGAIKEAVNSVERWAGSRNLKISISVAPNLTLIYADRDKIIQAIINLLSNAIKFTPTGGNINIEAAKFKPQIKSGIINSEGEFLKLSIEDNGMGISKEQQNKIFERFESGESSRTSGVSGTGLGLPIVKQIVDSHRGKIWVESQLGKGSKFVIVIPGRSLQAGRKEPTKQSHNGKKILIMDDEDSIRELLGRELIKRGYSVTAAKDGLEGLKKASERYYDLVITDIRMPNLDGIDCIRILKRMYPNTFFMVITGFPVEYDLEEILKKDA